MKTINTALLAVLFLVLTGCETIIIVKDSTPPPKKTVVVHKEYHYYPQHEIYYDPSIKVYVIFRNGIWVKEKTRPVVLAASTHIVIKDGKNDPWRRHSYYHQRHYVPPKEEPAKKQGGTWRWFYYYPSAQVYYNKKNNKYIYNIQGKWIRSSNKPEMVVGKKPVIIRADTAEPWKMHKTYTQKYPPIQDKPTQGSQTAADNTAADSGPGSQGQKLRRFHYYPKAQVYYDPVTKKYAARRNGKWYIVSQKPPVINKTVYVIIKDGDPKPWRNHAKWLKKHPPNKPVAGGSSDDDPAPPQDEPDKTPVDDPAPAGTGGTADYEFYYYPAVQIYYNPRTSRYIVRSQGKWLEVAQKPKRIAANTYVVIKDNNDQPWRKHGKWRNKYPPQKGGKPGTQTGGSKPGPDRGGKPDGGSTPAAGSTSTSFYYYPQGQVYYDVANKLYYIFKGGKWTGIKNMPQRIKGTSHVQITDKSGTPWKRHAHYKKTYKPGNGGQKGQGGNKGGHQGNKGGGNNSGDSDDDDDNKGNNKGGNKNNNGNKGGGKNK